MLDSGSIPIPCPKCGRKTSKSIGWIKAHSQLACSCGAVITLKRDQFIREMRKADAAIDRFKRSFSRFNKL